MLRYSDLKRIQTSFRFKLFTFFTILTLLITFVFSLLYIRTEIAAQKKRAEQRANLLATHIASNVGLPLFAENRDMLHHVIADEASAYQDITSIAVSTLDGRTIYEYRRINAPAPGDQLSATVDVFSGTLSLSPDEAITGSATSSRAIIGKLQLAIDTSDMTATIRELTTRSIMVAFIFWLAVSLFSYLVLRQVTQSFRTFMTGLETIKAGNYAISIPVERMDEPGRAAAAVNALAEALRSREEENRRLQEELVNALRLEVQEEKKLLMARLIQSNRMTFLGLLASSMAHEINNPNGSIRLAGLYLSRAWLDAMPLLQRSAEEEGDFSLGGIPFSSARKEIISSCATIERNTELISNVVQDLRSYSLGERYEFRPDVNINQVIENAVTTVRAYGRHADMQVNLLTDISIPPVSGSRHQLEQVVINLLLNALQSLPDNRGEVTISSRQAPESGQVVITVSDNGVGIPPEELERLLEPFYSTKLDKGGSGLGLFVTNYIVSQHNGTLEFSSQAGVGTTVTVTLPIPEILQA